MQSEKVHYPRTTEIKTKNVEGTTESGFAEMIYMEPNPNPLMSSPVTEGRQTAGGVQINRSPGVIAGRITITQSNLSLERQKMPANVVARGISDEKRGRSPKTINMLDSKEETEYNIRTLNPRKSPQGGMYQTYTNLPEASGMAYEHPMNYGSYIAQEGTAFPNANDSNVMVTSMGGQIKQGGFPIMPQKDSTYVMVPRDGREALQTISKMSPTKNVDEINSPGDKGYNSQSELNRLKHSLVKNMPVEGMEMPQDMIHSYKDDINKLGEILNARSNPAKEGYSEGEIKHMIKKVSKYYDPKKTKEGTLISENKTIIHGAPDDMFNDRYRVLQKMNKLSSILLSNRRGDSLNRSLNGSFDDGPSRKTFNRETLTRNDPKVKKIPLNRSPEQRFLYVSLAMLSSKGPNCEDRIMLRKYRLDKGGVVDLAQEEGKKGKFTVKKVHKRKPGGTHIINRTNPKYREKAAKIIQAWWRELKERYDKIVQKIILIQSCWRGKWVRKYMYDILYLSLMYQSFCQIIQKVLVKHVRPLVWYELFGSTYDRLALLRNLLLKDERFKALRMRPYWDKWLSFCKTYRDRMLKSRKVVDIRAKNDALLALLKRLFDKWRMITSIKKKDDNENQKRKFFGFITLMNGSDKAAKRTGLRTVKPPITRYLDDQLRQKAITSLLHANPKFKKILLRNYFNKWKTQVHKLQMKNMRDRIFDGMFGVLGSKMKLKFLRRAFQQWWRNLPKNTEIDFFNGSVLLRKAVLRKTHKDPLNAIKEKEDSNNLQDSIMRLLGVKARYIKYHWRDYLYKWRTQTQKLKDNEIKNHLYLKLLDTMFGKRKHRIMSNRFNHWRKVPKVDVADIFERFGNMINFTKKVVDEKLKPIKKDFLTKLQKAVSPKSYKKAIDILLEKYLNGNKNWMRYILYKWRDQWKNIEIYDLKVKLLQAQAGRNNVKNRKLILSKAFHKWQTNTTVDSKVNDVEDKLRKEIEEKENIKRTLLNKEYGAKLLKNLKKHFNKNDDDARKKRVFDIWRVKNKEITEKTEDNVNKGTNKLKRYNTMKSGPVLLDNLKNTSKLKNKKNKLKTLPGRYRKYELINLLRYFLRWKLKANAIKESENHRQMRNRYVRRIVTSTDKGKLMKYFYIWKNTEKPKEFNKFPIIVGNEQLHRALIRNAFKTLIKRTAMMNLKIPYGMSIHQALIRGNKNIAKSIVFRNILQRPAFTKWKKAAKHLNAEELRSNIFNKLMMPNINKNKKIILRHKWNKWKESVDDIAKKELQKNLYMKLMGKMYDKGAKFALRKTFGKWKQNYQDYVKRLNDAGKATYKLRHFVTRPILDKFRVTIMNQGKFDKVKQMIINALRKNDHGNLTYLFNKWKNNANKLKELSIKGRLLRSLAKHQDYKNDDIKKARLMETILKWRIKSTPKPKNPYEQITNTRIGFETLEKALRKPHNKNIYDGIKDNANKNKRNTLLRSLLNKLAPKYALKLKQNAFENWISKLGDSDAIRKRLYKLLHDYLTNIHDDLIGKHIRDLIDALKAYVLLKNNKAKPIKDFCRGLLNIKRQMEILRRNILLKKLFSSLGVYTTIKAKQALNNWLRNAKKKTTNDNADKIQKFLKSKLGNAGKRRKRLEDASELLKKYIMKVTLDKIKKDARDKALKRILMKLYNYKDQMNKKTLETFFNKWKDLIPGLRKNEAALTIQTAYRGLRARRKVDNLRNRNRKLKYLLLKLIGKEGDNLRIYFNKWLAQIEKENCNNKANTIQSFLNDRLKNLKTKKAKDKLHDLLKKYIIRILTDAITKASKVRGDRGLVLYRTLEDIYIRRPFNKLILALKWLSKINTLRKLLPNIQRALRLYWLPFYTKKWYDNTLGLKDSKAQLIQDWLRDKLESLRRRRKLRREQLLAKFLAKLANDRDLMLRIPFKYWQRVSQYWLLDEKAVTIDKMWRGHKDRKNILKALAKKKIKDLINKATKKEIANTIKDANDKFAEPLRKNLKSTKPIDKRYATNNVIDYANDELRNRYLLYLTGKRDYANRLAFLRLYFDRWRDITKKYNDSALTIQTNYRGKLARDKLYRLRRLRDILYALVMRLSDDDQSKLKAALRRWLNRAQAISCDEKSKVIQNFVGPRYQRLKNNRIKKFFTDRAPKIVKRRINNAVKTNNLQETIKRILINEFIKRLRNKDKWDKWRLFIAKRIHDMDGSLSDLILKTYFERWRKNAKKLTQLYNDSAEMIQRDYRMYLAKKLVDMLRKRKAKLLRILLRLIDNEELKKKVALHLWNHNAKAIANDENARIIQDFVGKILEKLKNKLNRKNLKRYSDGLDILSKLKPHIKEAFDKIKNEAIRKRYLLGLTKLFDLLDAKRKDHLKTAYDAIRDSEKDKLLNKLFKIPDSARLRILRKWFDIWKDNADKLGKDWAARTIQRAWRNYIIRKRFNKLNDKIKDLLRKLAEKYANMLGYYFNKWRTNVKKNNVLKAGKRINNFLEKKIKDNRAKRNWHKLSDLLNIKNGNILALDLLARLRKFMAINRFVKPIKHRIQRDGWDQFLLGLKWKRIRDKLYLLFNNFDKRKEINSMLYCLRKWRDTAMRIKEIEDALQKADDAVNKRRIIISADILNSAFLIKKLFHDIPRARALEFFKRLRDMKNHKQQLHQLSDTLIKAKDDVTSQNKSDLINKLYRLYIYTILDKMLNGVDDVFNNVRKYYGKHLLTALKSIKEPDEEFEYNNAKAGENKCPKKSLKFRAHVVNPKQLPMKDDNKDTKKILLPYLINYLNKKFKERKQYALDKIKNNDKYKKFCDLIKQHVDKQILPTKKEFIDELNNRGKYLDTYGELYMKLFTMLRKYFIRLLCTNLREPSRMYKLIYLIRIMKMHKSIARQRFIRELIRKWRFITFVKKMSRRKLELMYKSLHISYLQMANEVFGDDDGTNNPSIIKEFERFGAGIGMFTNEDPTNIEEEKYCKGVSKKYHFEPVVIEKEMMMEGGFGGAGGASASAGASGAGEGDYYVDAEVQEVTTGKYKVEGKGKGRMEVKGKERENEKEKEKEKERDRGSRKKKY